MVRAIAAPLAVSVLLLAGCERAPVQVVGPFYLSIRPDESEVSLYRCPMGVDQGCAIDDLPVLNVIEAGGDRHYVTINSKSGFYYFKRTDWENRGWGNNPETIVGPLSRSEFEIAKRKLGLPEFAVRM